MIHSLSETDNLDTIINGNSEVILKLGAIWCSPCKQQDKVLEELKDSYMIVKIDVDNYPALTSIYNVMSLPTIIYLKDGEIINRTVGLTSVDKIKKVFI